MARIDDSYYELHDPNDDTKDLEREIQKLNQQIENFQMDRYQSTPFTRSMNRLSDSGVQDIGSSGKVGSRNERDTSPHLSKYADVGLGAKPKMRFSSSNAGHLGHVEQDNVSVPLYDDPQRFVTQRRHNVMKQGNRDNRRDKAVTDADSTQSRSGIPSKIRNNIKPATFGLIISLILNLVKK